MTNEQKQVMDWMKAFSQEIKNKPYIPSLEIRQLRAKLILEEALETIRGLGVYVRMIRNGIEFIPCITQTEFFYEESEIFKPNLEDIADGCSDLKVVTEGTLVACGLLKQSSPDSSIKHRPTNDPLFDEVMRSNWTKFWTEDDIIEQAYEGKSFDNATLLLAIEILELRGFVILKEAKGKFLVKNKSGKIIKPESFEPPKLKEIIEKML